MRWNHATVKGDSAEAVANFASELFGERFAQDSACTEKYQTLPAQRAPYLPDLVLADGRARRCDSSFA